MIIALPLGTMRIPTDTNGISTISTDADCQQELIISTWEIRDQHLMNTELSI